MSITDRILAKGPPRVIYGGDKVNEGQGDNVYRVILLYTWDAVTSRLLIMTQKTRPMDLFGSPILPSGGVWRLRAKLNTSSMESQRSADARNGPIASSAEASLYENSCNAS